MSLLITLAAAALSAAPPPPATEEARPIPDQWITNDDYPADALRRGAEGRVQFRLDVTPDGRVSGCTILVSSGDSVLDSTTCALLTRRARFERAARPGPRTYARSVFWRLPREMEYAYEAQRLTSTVEAARGAIARCSTGAGEASATPPLDRCRTLLPPSLIRWLELQGETAAVTLTLDIVPQPGPPPPGPRAEWGRLVSLARAEVRIAPDGTIFECRETARQMPMPLPMLAFPHDMCAFDAGERPSFAPIAGTDERRARMIVSVHLRREGAR